MDTGVLFGKINHEDASAASVLREAGLNTDSDLQQLTKEDLRDLFPRPEQFKRRKLIFDTIHNQKPISVVMKELQNFIPAQYLEAALTNNGILVGYLGILKDMKTQMNKVQEFLDAHISLLEEYSKSQPPQDQDKGSSSSTSVASGSLKCDNSQTSNHPQTGQGRSGSSTSSPVLPKTPTAPTHGYPQKSQVTYKMVVSGKTFDAHLKLLDKLKTSSGETDLVLCNWEEGQGDCQVTILFCPVVSRIGTDAEAALRKVSDDEPVILVLMHHQHEAKTVTFMNTWEGSRKVVLCVHVFYHETVRGLVSCQENNVAISKIKKELMSRSVKTAINTSGNAENENKSWFSKFYRN